MPDFLVYIFIAIAGVNVAKFLHRRKLTRAAVGLSAAALVLSGWMAAQHLIMAVSIRSLVAAVIGAAFCWPAYESWSFLRSLGAWQWSIERLKGLTGR